MAVLDTEILVNYYFEEICKIPHGSYNEEKIADFVEAFAKEKGFRYHRDHLNNIVIYKEASQGYENHETLMLEAHMDMVNEKNKEVINKERGIMRKISSLKSFYNYFFRVEKIKTNPAALVRLPKLHDKEIIRLDIDEVAMLLDEVEQGESLTDRQKAYHDRTKVRDLALLTLLLGTGIRVSECVGLDIQDVDFKNGGIHIHRKGGKEVTVYFGAEVEDALNDYLAERQRIDPEPGSENALFLSMQRKRMNVRSVENLVKKYAKIVTPLKKITPHKLRSTYGTNLYRETGDIYLVADVLGHSDVNTTKKHYAALEDERRRSARNAVRLREKE